MADLIAGQKARFEFSLDARRTAARADYVEKLERTQAAAGGLLDKLEFQFNEKQAALAAAQSPGEKERIQKEMERLLEAETQLRRQKREYEEALGRRSMVEQAKIAQDRQELERAVKDVEAKYDAAGVEGLAAP